MFREYKFGDHPEGFIGLHLAVGDISELIPFSDNGVMRTPNEITLYRQEADKRYAYLVLNEVKNHKEWVAYRRRREVKFGSIDTGIRGISAHVKSQKKLLASGVYKYANLFYVIVTVGDDATRFTATTYVKSVEQWRRAIMKICALRGITAPSEWLNFPISEAKFNSRMDAALLDRVTKLED